MKKKNKEGDRSAWSHSYYSIHSCIQPCQKEESRVYVFMVMGISFNVIIVVAIIAGEGEGKRGKYNFSSRSMHAWLIIIIGVKELWRLTQCVLLYHAYVLMSRDGVCAKPLCQFGVIGAAAAGGTVAVILIVSVS